MLPLIIKWLFNGTELNKVLACVTKLRVTFLVWDQACHVSLTALCSWNQPWCGCFWAGTRSPSLLSSEKSQQLSPLENKCHGSIFVLEVKFLFLLLPHPPPPKKKKPHSCLRHLKGLKTGTLEQRGGKGESRVSPWAASCCPWRRASS